MWFKSNKSFFSKRALLKEVSDLQKLYLLKIGYWIPIFNVASILNSYSFLLKTGENFYFACPSWCKKKGKVCLNFQYPRWERCNAQACYSVSIKWPKFVHRINFSLQRPLKPFFWENHDYCPWKPNLCSNFFTLYTRLEIIWSNLNVDLKNFLGSWSALLLSPTLELPEIASLRTQHTKLKWWWRESVTEFRQTLGLETYLLAVES